MQHLNITNHTHLLSTISLLVTAFTPGLSYALEYGNPTADEQAHLEAINRARLNPLAEADRLGIDLFEGTVPGAISANPVQPLSSNTQLLDAARSHSQDMLDRNYFAHDNPDSESPFDRITSAGYEFQTAGENIAFRGSTGGIDESAFSLQLHDDLFLDLNFPDRGHRVNILNPDYREAGIGLAFGLFNSNGTDFNSAMVTTDFGRTFNSQPIILGVVYNDLNENGIYDAGEGLDNIDITFEEVGLTIQTATAGGYAQEVEANSSHSLLFTHPELGSITKQINVTDLNVKIDVLASELDMTSNNLFCATFANNQLSIPCIEAGENTYRADFSISNPSPLQLNFETAELIEPGTANQCAVYDPTIAEVDLPCVKVQNQTYWAKFNIIMNSPITMELDSFGLN